MTRKKTQRFALVLFLCGFVAGLSAATTTATPPANARTACAVDGDCEVARRLPTCNPCGSCENAPFAVARRYVQELEAQRRACARAPSEAPPNCAPCPGRPASDTRPLRAVCTENVCALREAATR
jgi:hypothetical protein